MSNNLNLDKKLTRSQTMARVKSKDTKPEILVRKLLRDLGYRYRIHCKNLHGKPDIAFISRKKAIFVHGCFWHLHEGCRFSRIPKSNSEYWIPKLNMNKLRDIKNEEKLFHEGWKVLVIWTCELKKIDLLRDKLASFMSIDT